MGKDTIGLVLVILGVGLAAGFAARNGVQVNDSLARAGKAALTSGPAAKAKTAYCAARGKAELSVADGCPDPKKKDEKAAEKPAEKQEAADAPAPKAPDFNALVAKERTRLVRLRASTEVLTADLAKLRTAWLDAEAAAVVPAADAKAKAVEIPPGTRVSEWFSVGGLFFMLGLGLIVIGSLIARQAAKAKAIAEPAAGGLKSKAPQDFGAMLADLLKSVEDLAKEAAAETDPSDERFEAVRLAIEALQFDKVEPLIESRGRVQARHGMAVFAAIYSPLSGGERNLNRAWSALVDEHWPEATSALGVAAHQFKSAQEELNQAA
jgi:hypothetical protein